MGTGVEVVGTGIISSEDDRMFSHNRDRAVDKDKKRMHIKEI